MNKSYYYSLCVVFLLFVLAGCGLSSNARLKNFAEDAKKLIDPVDLQNWAATVLKTNSDSGILDNTNVPISVRNLSSQGSPFEFASVNKDNIDLVWGGGFGRWGICVGSPTLKLDNDINHYCIEWKPGVYFVSGP